MTGPQRTLPPHSVDVAIIGAGVAGCAAALFLARAGVSVCVFEARDLGEGASGRCIGLPWSGFADSPWRLQLALGETATDKVLQLCAENQRLLETECGLTLTGSYRVALDDRESEALDKSRPIWARNGVVAEPDLPSGTGFVSGLYLPSEGPLNPKETLLRLAERAQTEGAILLTRTPVTAVTQTPSGSRLDSPQGVITAMAVVFATGAWGAAVNPWFHDKVLPVREQVQSGPLPTPTNITAMRAQMGHVQWVQQNQRWSMTGCRWATPHLEVGESDDHTLQNEIQTAQSRVRAERWGHTASPSDQHAYLWAKSCDGLPIIGPMLGHPTWVCCTGFMGNDWGFGLRAAQAVANGLLHGQAPGIPQWMTPARFG